MVSQGASSQCSKPFLRRYEGKLFLVETPGIEKQEGLTSPNCSHAEEASAAGGTFLAL
jgi:hypothetical protein